MSEFSTEVKYLENGNMLVKVGDDHLAKVVTLVGKANRRAEREGIEERVEIVTSGVEVIEVKDGLIEVNVVEINVPVLRKSGWKMVAALDFLESGVIVRTAPGESLEGWERPDQRTCDHCQTKRGRNRSFVVASESGETLQVGSSCLTAFIGFSPSAALSWMGFADDLVEASGSWGGARVPSLYSVETVLRLSYAISDGGRGYVPARDFDRTPTAHKVAWVLNFRGGFGRDKAEQEAEVAAIRTKADEVPAEIISEIVDFGKALDGQSDYVQNVQILLDESHVGPRHVGLLASVVKVWAKQFEVEAERKANPVTNEWVSEVKTRLRGLKVVVTKVAYIEGDYGVSTLLVMRDDAGHAFKWFASGAKEVEAGDEITLDATVKAHEEFNGTKQTVLTRGKIKDPVDA